MKTKIKNKNRLIKLLPRTVVASAVVFAGANYAIAMPVLHTEVLGNQEQRQSLDWLRKTRTGDQTIQIATVFGRENCQSLINNLLQENQLEANCFQSSEHSNRFFVLTGSYPTIAEANSAANLAGLKNFQVSSLNRIKETRCDIEGLSSELTDYCQNAATRPKPNDLLAALDQSNADRTQSVEIEQSNNKNTLSESSTAAASLTKEQLFEPAGCSQLNGEEISRRRRPGYPVLAYEAEDCREDRLQSPRPTLLADPAPVPDRWRIVDSLGYAERWWDPYNGNNRLKGDKPIFGKPGKDWFFNLSAISDTVYEPRNFPVPVGNATTSRAGQFDLIADGDQYLINENLIVETVLYRGDTVFRPPDHEFRLITVFNVNHTVVDERGLLKADPDEGVTRTEGFIGIQGAFWDYHIRNVSDRYDFDSFRIGIQPFSSDFRGFLFQDNQFGVRFFGTRDNNIFQYNLAWFRRLEKEINSGLNDIADSLRDDDIFTANLFWQDFPRLGFISQASITHNRNREADDFFFDDNAFIARPSSLGFERGRDYDVTYLGLSGDGHFGRNNLTYSAYYAFGDQSNGVFTNEETDISAYFLAAEYSRDFDWIRARASFLHTSGDDNPFDNKEKGFDAIFENPQFAGGDTAFFIRQNVPLIGGGRVALNSRNSIIPSLRSSKELGQSNFTNPGLTLLGIGADFDLTPQTRLSFNVNQMWFDDTSSLELARNQSRIRKNIGQDISAALIWRPFATQNAVFRLSGAVLNPGKGFEDLYGEGTPYSVLANLILAY